MMNADELKTRTRRFGIDVAQCVERQTRFWLKSLLDYGCTNVDEIRRLVGESSELIAILTASSLTAKRFYKRTR